MINSESDDRKVYCAVHHLQLFKRIEYQLADL